MTRQNKEQKLKELIFDSTTKILFNNVSTDKLSSEQKITLYITEKAFMESFTKYTEDELDQLLEFYKSPLGQKALEVSRYYAHLVQDRTTLITKVTELIINNE